MGASAVVDVGAPGTLVWSYTRSSNSTRAFLKPVVLTFARLCATLSMFCCWALIPLAAVYSARIISMLLRSLAVVRAFRLARYGGPEGPHYLPVTSAPIR